jgi:hypothetical protein
MKLELVAVPVSDVDRAKAFCVEKAGFNADHDQRVNQELEASAGFEPAVEVLQTSALPLG